MLDEWLNQVIRGVVRAGRGAFIATSKGKLDLVGGGKKLRFVLQQPFINRAKLLDIERSVVDADDLASVWVMVQTQRPYTPEQDIVAEGAVAE